MKEFKSKPLTAGKILETVKMLKNAKQYEQKIYIYNESQDPKTLQKLMPGVKLISAEKCKSIPYRGPYGK